MAVDPVGLTAIRVGQLPEAPINLSDNFAHEVGTDLKRATIKQLSDLIATQISSSGGVGYLPISVTDGQQLPDVPTDASFFLCGKGTFLNINGYPDIVCTEELNAIMSVTDHWEIAVEIPIEVNPENIGISQTVNLGVLDSAPSQDAVYKAINQYVNAVGSFHYADLASQTTPQAIAANIDEKLLNDALGAYTNVSNAPYGVSSTYDATTNQLDFSQLSIGDLINFRIDLLIDTSGADQLFKFYIKFGIGSPSAFTLNIAQGQVKTTSLFRVSEDVCFDIGNADIRDYPAEIWIATNKVADITINGWYLEIVRKNINIVEINDSKQNKLVAGTNITIDETDPLNPVISASGSGGGSETTTTMGALINSATSATPNDTDLVATAESGGLLKKITWTNVKAFLKTYFDTLYAAALGSNDNYVTDAQLVVIGNTSGTNTGDQDLSGLQPKGVRITNATTTGSYAIDWNAADVWQLTLTGAATLTDTNLPTGTATKVVEYLVKGVFSLQLPIYYEAAPSSQTYDGTKWNHIVVSCVNGTTGSEKVIYSNEVLAT